MPPKIGRIEARFRVANRRQETLSRIGPLLIQAAGESRRESAFQVSRVHLGKGGGTGPGWGSKGGSQPGGQLIHIQGHGQRSLGSHETGEAVGIPRVPGGQEKDQRPIFPQELQAPFMDGAVGEDARVGDD